MLKDNPSNGILKMRYCVGLTGTIASGKSTAASYFKRIGIDVIDADEIARALVAPHQPALLAIKNHFGSAILTPTGELNRRKLRGHMLKHPQDKAWLESLLHPKIRQEIQKKIATSTSPYVLIEIPLLMERDNYPYLNRILLIRAQHADQISRLQKRDHCTEDEALSFLSLQKNQAKTQILIADDIIENDDTLEVFFKKLDRLHHDYLMAAKNALISSSVREEK